MNYLRWCVLLFVLVGSSASAEWQLVAKNDHGLEVYGDKSRIHIKLPSWVLGWELQNIPDAWIPKIRGNVTFMSAALQKAHNCIEGTSAVIYRVEYSQQMGKGEVVKMQSIPESEWEFSPYPPGSPGEELRNYYCREFAARLLRDEDSKKKPRNDGNERLRM